MDITNDSILLLAEYGSRAYGTATAVSDHDLMGIYLESDAQIYGLAETKTQMTSLGRRSGSGDTDVTMHPLRKYVSLAAGGNPTVLCLLWSPEHMVEKTGEAADQLIAARRLFVTKLAISSHLGYALSQYRALAGQRSKKVSRPELVAAHGYDTKFAGHLVRVLLQGLELARHGGYTLPMNEEDLAMVRSVRAGEPSLDEVLARAGELAKQLRELKEASGLPERADHDAVNELLVGVRRAALAS